MFPRLCIRPVLAMAALLATSLTSFSQTSSPGLTTLYSFAGGITDGSYPVGSLTLGPNGVLCGTTALGGGLNFGTVFQVQPPGTPGGPWTETLMYSFPALNGYLPQAGVLIVGNSQLYGTTYNGGQHGFGMVFRLGPLNLPASAAATWLETIIYSFAGYTSGADGQNPASNLVPGPHGVLYGTTAGGGVSHSCAASVSGCGTVYQIVPPPAGGSTGTETVLHRFTGRNGDGANPFSAVVVGRNGALYGATSGGGFAGQGTVFQLQPPSTAGGVWVERILYEFTGALDGGYPDGIMMKNGVIYGATALGGVSGGGTVFQLQPPAVPGAPWTETVLYSFKGPPADGFAPVGTLVMGNNGALYGATGGGGTNGGGTIYELVPPPVAVQPWTEIILHNFSGKNGDGFFPAAGLVMDQNGTFYGVTASGGLANAGTVFQLR